MARIVINSDDFGLDESTNHAIIKALRLGLISSTSCLVNFEDGFSDAINLYKLGKIRSDQIGIHLNLTQGKPCLSETTNSILLCKNSEFNGSIRQKPIFSLKHTDRKIITNELTAQIELFIKSFGFAPSHIDGHHHIHTEWAVIRIVAPLAKKYGIGAIRISRNVGNVNFAKNIYKVLLNRYISISGKRKTKYFGDIHDFLNQKSIDKDLEVMVHAKFGKKEQLIDLDGSDLEDRINLLRKKLPNYIFSNYSQL